jgi:endonuclease/exonuclease/phosphatase family metal-dependent hydrolase
MWAQPVYSDGDVISRQGMRYSIFLLATLELLLMGCTATEAPGLMASRASLKVMTFNIRWQGHDDDGNYIASGFANRKPLVLDVLTQFGADVIGLQEASIEQRAEIASELTEFGMFPLPVDPGDECILYRMNRFDLKDSGHEHLRRAPEKPGTNIGVRDFVWVYLHDRNNGKRFYVISVHTDHRSSKRGRQLDGVLIGEWIRNRKYSDPVILTGDFNGTPDKPRYLYLTGQRDYPGKDGITVKMPMPMLDTFTVANPNARYSGTNNSGYLGKKNRSQIDYIFVPRGTKVIDSRIIYYHVNGAYPSDHFPLLSEFELE